ncbi:MAG TPA: hypothetical protein VGM81_08095 [Burkholderiaceae bacterium]|jgi:hypothetical protein
MQIKFPASWLTLLGATLLAGCAATPPTALKADQLAGIHKVAVVSTVARNFERQYIGFTVFGNELDKLDITDWQLDAQYEEQLSAALKPYSRLQLVPTPDASAPFASALEASGGNDLAAAGPATQALCRAQGLDAVILVARESRNDFLGNSNAIMRGIGVFARPSGSRVSHLHLLATVALLGCKTGAPLAQRDLRYNFADGVSYKDSVTARPIDTRHSRLPVAKWDDAQRKFMRDMLVSLPAHAWAPTLATVFGPPN